MKQRGRVLLEILRVICVVISVFPQSQSASIMFGQKKDDSLSNPKCRYHLMLSVDPETSDLKSELKQDLSSLSESASSLCEIYVDSNLAVLPGTDWKPVNKGILHHNTDAGEINDRIHRNNLLNSDRQINDLIKLYQGARIKCKDIESCITVEVADDFSFSRRRLMAVYERQPVMVLPHVPMAAALTSFGFLLIFVTMLCVCHKKKDVSKQVIVDEDDVTLNKITLRGSGAAYASPINGADFYAVPTKCKDENRTTMREDNGLCHKRDDSRGSRCATLDRRLPAPPSAIPSVPDDLDPTYDIIPGEDASKTAIKEEDSRTMDSDSQSYEPINRIYASVQEDKKSCEIVYEEVNNTRPSSMMEDIMERTSMMESSIHSVHSVQSTQSRASYFSDSDERPMSNLSARLSLRSLEEHYASPDEARISGGSGDVTPVADVRRSFPGSLYDDDSSFALEPPPVPERRYCEDDVLMADHEAEPAHGYPAQYSPPVHLPLVANLAAFQAADMNGMDFHDPNDPRYIQVTARESLASIRARQAALARHEYDNFYEPIDGDDPPKTPVRPISPPLPSLDMYGADYDEINYAVPELNFDDKSDLGLYSDIKDSPQTRRHAATRLEQPREPPLHASSLLENNSIIYADADSPLPDRRNRAVTVGSMPSCTLALNRGMLPPPAMREAVYAVPQKEGRNRSRSEGVESQTAFAGAQPYAPVYALVDKAKKSEHDVLHVDEPSSPSNHNAVFPPEANVSADFDVCAPLANYDGEISFDKSPSTDSFDGVRIPHFDTPIFESSNSAFDLRTRRQVDGLSSDRTSLDSGLYQRVDIEELKPSERQETRYSNLSEDAVYSIIPHEEKTLAREQMFHMDNHSIPDDFWVKREHVYQEVDDEMIRAESAAREIPVTVL